MIFHVFANNLKRLIGAPTIAKTMKAMRLATAWVLSPMTAPWCPRAPLLPQRKGPPLVRSTPRQVATTLIAAACGGLAVAEASRSDVVSWGDAFATDHEPAAIHYRASYRGSDGNEHRLEVWRLGAHFLRRRTEDRMDLYIVSDASAGGGLRYRIPDHARRAMIDVDRANPMRIGFFPECDALAHAMAQPRGGYRIAPLQITPVAERRALRGGAPGAYRRGGGRIMSAGRRTGACLCASMMAHRAVSRRSSCAASRAASWKTSRGSCLPSLRATSTSTPTRTSTREGIEALGAPYYISSAA